MINLLLDVLKVKGSPIILMLSFYTLYLLFQEVKDKNRQEHVRKLTVMSVPAETEKLPNNKTEIADQ